MISFLYLWDFVEDTYMQFGKMTFRIIKGLIEYQKIFQVYFSIKLMYYTKKNTKCIFENRISNV